jgi:glycosyltransferase involved in cell wall biosynthesis
MRTLILAAGRFGEAMRSAIATGREPRLDVFELARALGADVSDYLAVETASGAVRAVHRAFGPSAALAYLGFSRRSEYDAILTSGEDIGIPLAMLLKAGGGACAHAMIAHTLAPLKKRIFFKPLGAAARMDHILVYSTSEERHAIDGLGIPDAKVSRIFFHADQHFFRPGDGVVDPRLVCAAGQLLRDYDCLVDAVRGLDVSVQIAAGSPWIDHTLRPGGPLPPNVTWGKLGRHELRDLYARSALAVVPIKENPYQTGIATILEMMSMGKCVVATRTKGQTDTIVDGETGVYVPPNDPVALRETIQRLVSAPREATRIGRNARRFIEARASLDHFVERVVEAVQASRRVRTETRPTR